MKRTKEPRRAMALWLAISIVAAVVGCGAEDADTPAAASAAASAAAGEEQERMTLRVFDCGSLEIPDVAPFGLTNEDVAMQDLFVPCYLIEHPDGKLLWDAGLPPSVADSPDGVEMEGGGALQRYAATLDDQLLLVGLSPADVDLVAFSHMHFDHVGSANLFAGSTLLIQKAEHEAAFGPDAASGPVDSSLFADLADSETVLLEGDHDVFGDGRVLILSAPGHTPGHQALFLDLEDTGPIVLSGDLYHYPESREKRAVPVFNHDAEETLASMDRIEAFLQERSATLWIEHDYDFAQSLRLSPEVYE